ncbi:MAG: hypothetical protein EKK64_00960 [Neisseriaceae bacterium]|nr:MAG: hypothetical protein EKK64_00960 [Neisseriaceae bacterium]
MVFNLNDFKAKLEQYGGPAKKNLFTVEFVSNEQTQIERDLIFFCKDINLPGLQLDVMEYRSDGFNMPQALPMGLQKDVLSCLIMLDDSHSILRFFHEWFQKVLNYDESNGKAAPRAGDSSHLPYEINYKSDYAARMIVKIYSINGSFYEIIFDGVYPINIGSLALGWGFNGDTNELNVSFSYSSIKVEGTKAGSAGDIPVFKISTSKILNLNDPIFITDIKNVVNEVGKSLKGIKTLFT